MARRQPSLMQIWLLVHGPSVIFMLLWNTAWVLGALYLIVGAAQPHGHFVRFIMLFAAAVILWMSFAPKAPKQ